MVDSTHDTISVDPTATYGEGDFIVTGQASSPYGVRSVTLQGFTNTGSATLGTTAVGADGSFSFTVPIRGTSVSSLYAFEIDNEGGIRGKQAGLSFDGNWVGKPYVATEDRFNAVGGRTDTLYFRANGSLQGQVSYTASGSLAWRSVNNPDGSNLTTMAAGGVTLPSFAFDTIRNAGEPDNTFVFDPGHGLDFVQQFRGGGADHDILSFQGSDFGNSIAEVLANAHQSRNGGVAIVDPTTGDAVHVPNLSKAELVANRSDIAFHS